MTVPLALEPQGAGWRLLLRGDWSLAAMPQIEAQLESLPQALRGPVLCDWSQTETPGIGPAWALLRRLRDVGLPSDAISHSGGPPHFLELLQKLRSEPRAVGSERAPRPTLPGIIGSIGRWSVLQGRHARGVIEFLGRIATVIGQAFRRPRAWRVSSLARHVYETGITAILKVVNGKYVNVVK